MTSSSICNAQYQVLATAGVLIMSNCTLQCGSCVGEALSASGDAHVALSGCTFDVADGCDSDSGGHQANICTGILSQHVPVLAERCMFVSSANRCALEGVRLQGSSHCLASCDWHRCCIGVVITDEACVQLRSCSWSLCDVGLHAVSKSKAVADACVLLNNASAVVLEEGAHARMSSSQFIFNQVAAAARSASLHVQCSACVFSAVFAIFDNRSTATLEDSAFFGGRSEAAADDDAEWLKRVGSGCLSAAAVAVAADCIVHAQQQQQQQQHEDAALQIVCAIKSVSSVTWCSCSQISPTPSPFPFPHVRASGARVWCATPPPLQRWRTRRCARASKTRSAGMSSRSRCDAARSEVPVAASCKNFELLVHSIKRLVCAQIEEHSEHCGEAITLMRIEQTVIVL